MGYSNESLARALKVERAKKGWTQDDLARESGVAANTIARYESGRNMPSLDVAVKMARALGCSVDELAGLQ